MEQSDASKKVPEFTKVPCITLQYKWDLKVGQDNKATTILSEMVKFRGKKSFIAGLKNRGSYATKLFFVTTNLNKLGIRVKRVAYIHNAKQDSSLGPYNLMKLEVGGPEDQPDGSVQLFTSPIDFLLTSDNNFTFHINICGIADCYRVQEVDCVLTEDLWSSALNRVGTDFELIVDGRSFPVHKVVLAARSSVFEAQFNNKSSAIESKQTIDCVNAQSMEQFLKFIYTGELDGLVIKKNSQLLHLAQTYQLKTLESICLMASRNIKEDDLGTVALQLEPLIQGCSLDITFRPPLSPVVDLLSSDTSVFQCTWTHNLPSQNNVDNIQSETSQDFQFQEKQIFRASLNASKSTRRYYQSRDEIEHSFTLTFLCYRRLINYRIDQVTYSIGDPPQEQFLLMSEKKTADQKLLQVFTSTQNTAFRLSITICVKVSRNISGFNDKLVDSTWNKQIGGAVRQLLTDVELLVGDTTFSAHRSILSARSPVFAAMFSSGMKESQTGSVRIDDVDSSTFKNFLDYLYTGMLPSLAINEQLYAVADKYQVEPLMNISKDVDVEDLTKVYLAL